MQQGRSRLAQLPSKRLHKDFLEHPSPTARDGNAAAPLQSLRRFNPLTKLTILLVSLIP